MPELVVQKARVRSGKIMQPGLCHYQSGVILIKQENLQYSIENLVGKPVFLGHKKISEISSVEAMEKQAIGYVSKVWYDEHDGWFKANFAIADLKINQDIDDGKLYCSTAYIPLEIKASGTSAGVEYVEEYTKVEFTHLALVENPRYEEAEIFNSKEEKTMKTAIQKLLDALKPKEKFNESDLKTLIVDAVSAVAADVLTEKLNSLDEKENSEEKPEEKSEEKTEEKENSSEETEEKSSKEETKEEEKKEESKTEEKTNSIKDIKPADSVVVKNIDLNKKYGGK